MTDDYDKKDLKKDANNTADDAKGALEETGDKIQAGAKAVGNKIKDPDRDTGTEYRKEKLKEDIE
ncbi:MAG: hypothetical protein H0X03_03830 [Nitrosopumilus sp.]|nr:hypothetical protein [Nitrosopumilus sp.]